MRPPRHRPGRSRSAGLPGTHSQVGGGVHDGWPLTGANTLRVGVGHGLGTRRTAARPTAWTSTLTASGLVRCGAPGRPLAYRSNWYEFSHQGSVHWLRKVGKLNSALRSYTPLPVAPRNV